MSAAILPIKGEKISPEMNTKEAMIVLSKGTDPELYLENKRQNVVIYVICQTWKRTLINSSIGAVAGGIVGGGIGFVVAGPAGVVPGAAIGAGVGGLAGAVITISLATAFYPITVSIDPVYRRWKELIIRENLSKSFEKAVLEHEELRDLQCPISCDFPIIPVMAPCGHIYDKDSIERHIDLVNARIANLAADRIEERNSICTCPSRKPGVYQKIQLTYAPDHLDKIIHACVKVNSILGAGKEDLILKHGLELAYSQAFDTYTRISSGRARDFFERTSADIKEGKEVDLNAFGVEMAKMLPPRFPSMSIKVLDKDEKKDK